MPDPSSNPYLAFSAMLMAGLDGIKNKIEPVDRSTRTSTSCRPRRPPTSRRCRAPFRDVLDALEDDHDYLQAGNVFTEDLIETWVDYKRSNEVDPMRLRPHPHEFELYYDI